MKIQILRDTSLEFFEANIHDVTLLEFLNIIKTTQDCTLTYSSGCRSGVCGSCAVRVNDKEVLACSYKLQDGDKIEPLRNSKVLRDLVVNMDKAYSFNKKAQHGKVEMLKIFYLVQMMKKLMRFKVIVLCVHHAIVLVLFMLLIMNF